MTLGAFAIALVVGTLALPLVPSFLRAAGRLGRVCRKEWGLAALVAVAVIYGGVKPPPVQVTWDEDIFATHSAQWNTNTYAAVTFTWTKKPTVPSSTTVYADYRRAGGEWERGGTASITDGALTLSAQGITNYQFAVYGDYVPPVPVHTNGVWLGQVLEKAKGTVGVDKLVIIKGKLYNNGREIAPCAK